MADTELETPESVQSPGATLADEMYAQPEVTTEPEPQQEDVVVKPDEPTSEDVEDNADDSTETIVEEPSNDDEIEVTTLEQLAEHLETEPDWIRGLSVTEKVNGKEIDVSISDALRTHRQVAAGDEYLADAKLKSKEMIESSGQGQQLIAASAAALRELLQEAESQLGNGMTDADWAKLRRNDPAEWTARKEDQREGQARIDAMKSRAFNALNATSTNQDETFKAAREETLPQEREIFLGMVPDWSDEEVATRESAEITEYLKSNGHTPDEMEMAAYNGKLLAYVRNSMLYERSRGKIDAAKKKVVKIPKIMKPGTKADDKKPTSADDPVSILYG